MNKTAKTKNKVPSATCNRCKYKILLPRTAIKKIKLHIFGEWTEIRFFLCPVCKTLYPAGILNKSINRANTKSRGEALFVQQLFYKEFEAQAKKDERLMNRLLHI